MPSAPPTTRDYAILAIILIGALCLRLIGLNGPLWYDEILTLDSHIRMPWPDMMQSYSMNHHYLHNLQAKLSLDLFGDDNWSLRLPALVFGVGSIAAVWRLANDVVGNRIAHLVAVLLALSYHHIWFSQNARGYTELAFWGTVGTILFLRGLKQPAVGVWLAYAITLVLATFTHLTGLILFAAHGLIWLLAVAVSIWGGSFRRSMITFPALGYLVGGVLTVLIYLPVLPSMLQTLDNVAETSAVDVMEEYQNPIWTLAEAIRTAIGSSSFLVAGTAVGVVLSAVAGGLATRRSVPWFGLLVLVHIGLTLGTLLALNMRVWPRFFFVDIGFLLILIVVGLRSICHIIVVQRPALARRLFLGAATAMIVLSGSLALRNFTAPKQDLAGAFSYVESRRSPGERVYGVGPAGHVFNDHFGADWQIIETENGYADAMAGAGPLWVVVAFPQRMFRGLPQMELDRHRDLAVMHEFPGTLGDGWVLVLYRS
ncbi:glycosyltransferase family 39 protein [Pseudoruegeria sp. SK021]|uniref:glycosyltransferase family 39 protein n=1 Tax=Pseudoruegeria sp. SK021 TaxID=1933035 RepID=UPI000A254F37|nr:glycosyltransferase family 39 protein [Pseudoruegeria sp. SK021]OSP55076.1 hypothetical protein BV911_09660 [Pseudoruegeria sp. SK021]